MIKSLENHGFKVNINKTQCIFFNTKDNISLNLNGQKVKGLDNAKYLGIIIDKYLTFKEHIKSLAKKGKKSLHILAHMSGKNWGLTSMQKRRIYRNYILPKMTYGEELFDLAPKKYLNTLDRIQNQALRNISGLRKSTKIELLHIITNIDPLHIRRKKKKLLLFTRFIRNKNNPAGKLFKQKNNDQNDRNDTQSLVNSTLMLKKKIGFFQNTIRFLDNPYPIWKLDEIKIDIGITKQISKKTTKECIMKKVTEKYIDENYKEHHKMYTDASKEANKVGVGTFNEVENNNQCLRATDRIAITTGELIAIDRVLQMISNQQNYQHPICICTDSLGACKALRSIEDKHARPDLSLSIHKRYTNLKEKGANITILWIPSHIGIDGNEVADRNANIGRLKDRVDINCKLGYNEVKSMINEMVNEKIYKKEIEENTHPKIKRFTEMIPKVFGKIKMEGGNKLLNRIRVGVTTFENANTEIYCRRCKTQITIEHCIHECKLFYKERSRLKDIFYKENKDFTNKNILNPDTTGQLENGIFKYLGAINKVFGI